MVVVSEMLGEFYEIDIMVDVLLQDFSEYIVKMVVFLFYVEFIIGGFCDEIVQMNWIF